MFSNKVHKIKSFTVDVEYLNQQGDQFKIQQEVKDWVYSFAVKAEKIFDGYEMTGGLVSINKLDLNANVHSEGWQKAAETKLLHQLQNKISAGIFENKLNNKEKVDEGFTQNFQQAFVYYLKYGHLPWNFYNINYNDWQQSITAYIENAIEDNSLSRKLVEVLASSNAARIRLSGITLFEKIIFLLTRIATERSDAIKIYSSLNPADRSVASVFLQELFLFRNDMSSGLFPLILSLQEKSGVKIKNILEAVTFKSSFFKEFQSSFKSDGNCKKKLFPANSETGLRDRGQPVSGENRPDGSPKHILKDGIFIENAGLILLASFLPTLFKNLKLVKNNVLINAPKAAVILNFLVTGQWKVGDYALVLPKILCGLDAETFIDAKRFRISKRIKEECEGLLRSIIEHWAILKNTSLEGLRSNFVQRNGKLSFENKSWLLQVERNSIDVLLEHLPWNYATIKLSWMKNILQTEW